MKLTTLMIIGSVLLLTACENPKPDLSGMKKDGSDNAKTDTMDKGDDGKFAYVDSATMMKAWEDFMTPGDMHKWMAKYDGTWTGETTAWMDPNGPPSKSTATVTQKMALNGLYQIGDFTGTMMGHPFMGHSILAYDNAKKQFVNTWIDNMGSGIVVMRGTLDSGTNTLSLKGTQTDPVTGKDSDIREEIKFIDDNTQIASIYGAGMDGKEMKFMEINMKRKM